MRVKFVNHSGREVQLYWINYIGECEKAFKIADGKSEIIDTYESHPWFAANARNRKVHHAFTVNSNLVYYPTVGVDGGRYSVAEIRKAPGNSRMHSLFYSVYWNSFHQCKNIICLIFRYLISIETGRSAIKAE